MEINIGKNISYFSNDEQNNHKKCSIYKLSVLPEIWDAMKWKKIIAKRWKILREESLISYVYLQS